MTASGLAPDTEIHRELREEGSETRGGRWGFVELMTEERTSYRRSNYKFHNRLRVYVVPEVTLPLAVVDGAADAG